MSIRKIRLSDSSVKWETLTYSAGRGSKRMRRRFDTKSEAEAFVHGQREVQKRAKAFGNHAQEFVDTTFGAEAEHWFQHRGAQMTHSSRLRVRQILESSVLPRFRNSAPLSIRKSVLQEYQTELLRLRLKPRTINRMVGVIKAVLNFSVEEERIPYNPTAKLKSVRASDQTMAFWTPTDAGAFLAFADGKYPLGSDRRWVYLVYLLRLNTAIRSAETWGLRVKDISPETRLIHCARQFEYTSKSMQPTKGKAQRFVPCNQVVLSELQAWIRLKKLGPDDLVFWGRTGQPIDDHSFNRNFFLKDVKQSGVQRINPHGLRHTATTLMIRRGIDLKTVQEICGHRHISTTMGYAHLLGESIRQVADEFLVAPKQAVNDSSPSYLRRHLQIVK